MTDVATLGSGKWLNEPPNWNLSDEALTIESGFETDFWRETLYDFWHDNGHALLVPVHGEFTAYLTFEGGYETLYDQAGLMLRSDATQWIKAGIEFSDDVGNMSVVVTRGASDWSMMAPVSISDAQRLRITRIKDAVIVQFRNAEKRWQLLRVAHFAASAELFIGPMACSPTRAGFQARFTEFAIGSAVQGALHDKSSAS